MRFWWVSPEASFCCVSRGWFLLSFRRSCADLDHHPRGGQQPTPETPLDSPPDTPERPTHRPPKWARIVSPGLPSPSARPGPPRSPHVSRPIQGSPYPHPPRSARALVLLSSPGVVYVHCPLGIVHTPRGVRTCKEHLHGFGYSAQCPTTTPLDTNNPIPNPRPYPSHTPIPYLRVARARVYVRGAYIGRIHVSLE